MKNNVIYHPEEIKRLNRINLIMRMIDQICTKDKIEPQTWEQWNKTREDKNEGKN